LYRGSTTTLIGVALAALVAAVQVRIKLALSGVALLSGKALLGCALGRVGLALSRVNLTLTGIDLTWARIELALIRGTLTGSTLEGILLGRHPARDRRHSPAAAILDLASEEGKIREGADGDRGSVDTSAHACEHKEDDLAQ